MKYFKLCRLNGNLRGKVISSVMLFMGNTILQNDFLDYFEEAVDHYSATGKPICLLGGVNINIFRAQTSNYTYNFLIAYKLCPSSDNW